MYASCFLFLHDALLFKVPHCTGKLNVLGNGGQGWGGGEEGGRGKEAIQGWASNPSWGSGNTPNSLTGILKARINSCNLKMNFCQLCYHPFHPLICPDKINTLSS